MNIVYSTSDLYSPLAGISMTSLLMNNQDVEEIHIIIMDNGISDENRMKLRFTAESFQRDIVFVPLADSLSNVEINLQKWDISTFGRLFEASSLPDYDRVIHIDCDTVIDGSLQELWDLDINRAVVAGASDCLSDEYKKNIGLSCNETYLNAGVLVLNLKKIREDNYEKTFLKYIEENSQFLTYVDQEVLNACIAENEKVIIPLQYNSYSILHYLTYKHLKILRNVNYMFSEQEFLKAKKYPIILHFTGCFLEGTRPWIMGDDHPLNDVFIRYKDISEWKHMDLWEDKRSVKTKIISKVIKHMPKCILAPIIGYVHGIYIPRRNKQMQLKGKRS